ncbi:hypothetical protein [Dactylosporangium sp. CA-092794]|uniref:hypothetical protein n=1 Tax=Dactylosporangium sp. CA-092794 TaxID=3239929 RepID=UPI003D92BD2E
MEVFVGSAGPLPKAAIDRFNGWVMSLRSSPRFGPMVRRHLTVVTYTGRRSGRTFSTPVAYKRAGDTVTIGVQAANAKAWWRNFLGEGGPITLHLDGADRTGHALARRDERGRVSVTVRLDQPPG